MLRYRIHTNIPDKILCNKPITQNASREFRSPDLEVNSLTLYQLSYRSPYRPSIDTPISLSVLCQKQHKIEYGFQ